RGSWRGRELAAKNAAPWDSRLREVSVRGLRVTLRYPRVYLNRDCWDAAHIVMDADEQLGQPIVSNGPLLTKIHHAAFDAHMIGIDPDFRVHVSDRLLEIHDGPFLELGLKRNRRHSDRSAAANRGPARSEPTSD